MAVHTEKNVQAGDALAAMRGVFEFIKWIDYCYGTDYEESDTKTLSENIFGKRIRLIAALQKSIFGGEEYRNWRQNMADTCHDQIMALNDDLISVRLKRQYVEKFRNMETFQNFGEGDKRELIKEIAPLVSMDDTDEAAKRFDNFMYGMILANIEGMASFQRAKRQLRHIASTLEEKAGIPQVKEKMKRIKEINTDEFWEENRILLFEEVRKELRGLMKFLADEKKSVVTKLAARKIIGVNSAIFPLGC